MNPSDLFSEFNSSNKALWEKQALKEINSLDSLSFVQYGIGYQPIYTSEDIDLGQLANFNPTKGKREWINLPICLSSDPKRLNELGSYLLEYGADGILFDTENKEIDFSYLANQIHPTKKIIAFYIPFDSVFLSKIESISSELHIGFIACHFSLKDLRNKSIWEAYIPFFEKTIQEFPTNSLFRLIPISESFSKNVIEEIAYLLSLAVTWIDELTEKGIDVSKIISHIIFSIPIHENYFLQIAKGRALRFLWTQIVYKAYGISDFTNDKVIIHCEQMMKEDFSNSHNNLIRNTTQAMSAILGGCNYLTVLPHTTAQESDYSFAAHRIASEVSAILKEESHFDLVNDPAEGSFFLESITQQLIDKSWNLFKEIEKKGGVLEVFN